GQHLYLLRTRSIALIGRCRIRVVRDDTQRPIGAGSPHMQRRERFSLHDVDQPLAYQLENGDERHRYAHPAFLGSEQAHEFYETRVLRVDRMSPMRSRTESWSR